MRGAVALDIDAEFEIVDPFGRRLSIRISGRQGAIEVSRSMLRLRSLRVLRSAFVRERLSGSVQRALAVAGLTLDVVCERRIVARLSASAPANWIGRLLGLAPVSVYPMAAFAALTRSARDAR